MMALPRLVALQWFIDHDYDTLLWAEYDEVDTEYAQFIVEVKRKYTTTHKRKKRVERQRIEQLVIGERSEEDGTKRRGKKRVYLTQEERQRVRELTELEKARRKAERVTASKTKKRRTDSQTKSGPACLIMGSIAGHNIST
jgi:hypothetical protein